MSKNYYDILGVSKNAASDEIKKAFRKISKANHPDMQSGKSDAEKKAAEERFKEAAEAYETLSDADKRKNYDMFGNGGSQNHTNFDSFFRGHGSPFSSFFNSFDAFSSGFSFSSFNNKAYNPNGPENGKNVQVQLNVTFKESLFGVTKEFDVNVEHACDECNGTGVKSGSKITMCSHCNGTGFNTQRHGNMMIQSTCMHCEGSGYVNLNPCTKCHGSKRILSKQHISVKIPAGVNTGNTITIKEKGQSGVNGGKNGNLIVIINVLKSEFFERSGNDIKMQAYISPIIASIGGTTDVTSPFGEVKMKIPAGTATGTKFRLKGKGIKTATSRGDLYVEAIIEPLSNLTDEQIQLLDKLNQTITDKNLPKQADLQKLISQSLA